MSSIIGAGPIGLFAVFELGLLDLKCHLVDILDRAGRPVHRAVSGKADLRHSGACPSSPASSWSIKLMEQIKPRSTRNSISARWPPALEKLPDGRWKLKTDAGTETHRPCGGDRRRRRFSFQPKRPPVPGIEHARKCRRRRGRALRRAQDGSPSSDKNILIAGGGDSALDWVDQFGAAGQDA